MRSGEGNKNYREAGETDRLVGWAMEKGSSEGGRLWVACLLGGAAAVIALGAGIDRQLVYLVVSLGAGVAIGSAVLLRRPLLRLPWLLAAVGLAVLSVGRVSNLLELGVPPDAFNFIAYCLLIVAVGIFLLRRGVTVELLIDVAIMFLSLSLIWWVLLLGSHASEPGWIADHALLLAYPLFDLVLLAGLIGLMLSPGPRQTSYGMLLVALASQFLTDTLDVRVDFDAGGPTPLWLEAGWILSIVLLAASALHPTMVDVGAHPHSEAPGLSRRRLGIFALMSAIGVMLTILTAPPGLYPSTIVTSVAAATLVTLMFTRLWLMTLRAESQVDIVTQQEKKLRANERRLEALLENSPDAIALLDKEGRITQATSSPGYENIPPEQAVGMLSFDFIVDEDKPRASEAIERAVAAPGSTISLTIRVHRVEGGHRWLDVSVTNLLDDPSVEALVINYRDVSERVQMELTLNEAQKMEALGRLAGGVAHDFNNVLSVIQGFTRFARDEAENEGIRNDLAEVLSASDRAAGLVAQLLTFARPKASEDTVELHGPMRDSAGLLKGALGEDVQLVIDVPREVAPIKLTPSQLDQILLNLAVNARDAMPTGGKLTLRSSIDTDKGEVELVAEDTGMGIPEEDVDRIFEPFFTTKEQGRGTGLGLATIYGIVKGAGGTISVSNRPEGGARFVIRLPLETQDAPVVAPLGDGSDRPPAQRVLLVEDEDGVRAAVRRLLVERGHSVVDLGDPSAAVATFSADPRAFDLLVTDIVMPIMSGVDLFERLAEIDPELKVVYLTGYADDAIRARGTATGRGQVVNKPFTPEELDAAIARSVSMSAS